MNRLNKLLIAGVAILAMGNSYNSVGQISNIHTVVGQPIMVKKKYDGIQGSPYFNEDWRTGDVAYSQQRLENIQMKYDAYLDQVEIIYNNAPFLPDKKMVHGFEFVHVNPPHGVVTYRFKNGFEGDGISKENYLNILHEGANFVLAERIKMDQISVTPATYGEREYKEFTLTRNYILVKQGRVQRFKPSKKSFAKEFPTIESKLKDYFKENKVDFNSYEELSKIAIFIDEMLTAN